MIPDRLGYFLDDFGNFENLVNILTRSPPNYYQRALKNTRKHMGTSWEILFMSIWDSKIEKFENMYVLGAMRFLFFSVCFFCGNEYIFLKYFCGDED